MNLIKFIIIMSNIFTFADIKKLILIRIFNKYKPKHEVINIANVTDKMTSLKIKNQYDLWFYKDKKLDIYKLYFIIDN